MNVPMVRTSGWTAAVVACVAVGVACMSWPAHAGGSGKASFDDPAALCHAIPSLPNSGWNAARESCKGGKNPCVYQVTGSGGKATALSLACLAGIPQGLHILAGYAGELSQHSAFHLTAAMLADIRQGKSFSTTAGQANIVFTKSQFRGALMIRPAGVARAHTADAASARSPSPQAQTASATSSTVKRALSPTESRVADENYKACTHEHERVHGDWKPWCRCTADNLARVRGQPDAARIVGGRCWKLLPSVHRAANP